MNTVRNKIMKGRTPVNMPLTNISVAYLQNTTGGATAFFPEVPVSLSTGTYNIFNKEDLLRDNVQRKPIMGKVAPTVISSTTDTYKCYPEQIIVGYDDIIQEDMVRMGVRGMMDIRKSKATVIAQNMFIHRNKLFAKSFFKKGIWENDYAGGTDFAKFTDTNSDPIGLISRMKTQMKKATGITPNKLGLGQNVFDALILHPDIINRVIYGGNTLAPAMVTEKALAAILGVDEVVVFDAIWNTKNVGAEADMQFICDENSMLLAYAAPTPGIDVASAGYSFTWDMGQGTTLPIIEWDGEDGTYSKFMGGMMSYDMKQVCKDLGMFFENAVDPEALSS